MATKTNEVKQEEKQKIISKDFPEYVRKVFNDPGLDETIQKLTPEKIQKAYNAVFGKISSRVKSIIDTCMHCGLCAEACQWYLSNDKDPTYAPVAKMRMTAWELINRKGQVDPEFIKQCARIVFTECNICHRCSMYCPFGLDITFIIGLVRRMCFLLGVMPQRQLDQAQAHIVTQNQVWLSQNDWIDSLLWRWKCHIWFIGTYLRYLYRYKIFKSWVLSRKNTACFIKGSRSCFSFFNSWIARAFAY